MRCPTSRANSPRLGTMADLLLSSVANQPPVPLQHIGDGRRTIVSIRWNLHRHESPRLVNPQYDLPVASDRRTVTQPDTLTRRVAVPSPATPAEPPALWKDAFDDLDEVARGVDLDGPIPADEALSASRRLLTLLTSSRMQPPLVDEFPGHGVAIEFPGSGPRTRLTFVIQDDGSVAYYELIDGSRWRGRFPDISSLLAIVWPRSFHAAGLLPRS